MPRTEHLSNISPNRIYALDAQILYKHQNENMTTAIIQQENVQSKIRIPHTHELNPDDITEGSNYHFGFCYVSPNGWINARRPDTTIQKEVTQNEPQIMPTTLHSIVNNCNNMNGNYVSTVLYVVAVNPVQTIVKNGKQLTLCHLNCYAEGYLVDLTLWNSDLPLGDLAGQWIIVSGFRLKKLIDWKFILVSSVYSKIAKYQGSIQGMPYSATNKYYQLSSIFEPRNILDVQNLASNNDKIYSQVDALISKIQKYEYEGCSLCKKKVQQGSRCPCNQLSENRMYSIYKLSLQDGNNLEVTVFDQSIQQILDTLEGPTRMKFNIKSTKRVSLESVQISHVVSKIIH